jgi:hypothetical protein
VKIEVYKIPYYRLLKKYRNWEEITSLTSILNKTITAKVTLNMEGIRA